MRRGYRRAATVASGLRGVSPSVRLRRLWRCSSSGQISSIWRFEARRGRRSCRRPTSRPCARSSSEACSAMRRSASSRGDAARLEPGQAQLARRLHDDHRAVFVARASTRRAAARRARRSPSAGAAAIWRRNSSPIAGMRDRLELLAGLVGHERPLGERGPVERPVGPQDLGAEPLDQLGERRRPGLHHLRGDRVGVDHHRAPFHEDLGDGRLARPDAAREPHHEHVASLRAAREPDGPSGSSGYAPLPTKRV